MPIHYGEPTDATLLQICASLRYTADRIVNDMTTHMEQHPQHSMTECQEGLARIAMVLLPLGASLCVNAAQMLEDLEDASLWGELHCARCGHPTGSHKADEGCLLCDCTAPPQLPPQQGP